MRAARDGFGPLRRRARLLLATLLPRFEGQLRFEVQIQRDDVRGQNESATPPDDGFTNTRGW